MPEPEHGNELCVRAARVCLAAQTPRTRCALVNLIIIKKRRNSVLLLALDSSNYMVRTDSEGGGVPMCCVLVCRMFFENRNAERENIINCRRVVMQDTLRFVIQCRRVPMCEHCFFFFLFPLPHVRCVGPLSYVAILAIFSGCWHRFVCVRQFVFHLLVHFKIRITCKRLDGARLAPTQPEHTE